MVVGLFDSDGLVGEDLTEIDFALFEADASTGCDGHFLVVEGIAEIGQAFVWPRRGPIALGWRPHCKGLVRALVVEAVDEVVELGLLLEEDAGSGLGGLELQGQVHALMAAILLRIAGLDALDLDTEPQPPDGELREIEGGVGLANGTPLSVRMATGDQLFDLDEPAILFPMT